MRQQNTNRAVPLDAVPERRTERCSPRFRPGDRFCELSFRYLSPGIEGEKCRPLDHMRQIPFIHSTRFLTSGNFYIYNSAFYLLSPCGTFKCVLVRCIFDNCTCALARTLLSRFRAIIQAMLCSIRCALVPTHKQDNVYACASVEQTKSTEKQSGQQRRRLSSETADKNTNHEFCDKIETI